MTAAETMLRPITPPGGVVHRADPGPELKRGAWTNFIAMLASNFRGVFTFLVARILGPAALGVFSVAWATTDLVSKIGIFGLDDAIITFIARAEARGDRPRSRSLFRLAVFLGVFQSTLLATISITLIRAFGSRFGLDPEMADALSVMFCAMPVIALYRVNTAVSRGMKVMRHDIFSRGITETIVTTLAFLGALSLGLRKFGPEIAVIVGMGASGIVALFLAASLFRRGTGVTNFQDSFRSSAASHLRRADQRLRFIELDHRPPRRRNARVFRRTRAWRHAHYPRRLRRLRRSRGRPAQSEPGFQPHLRTDRRRPHRDGDQDHAAIAFSRVSQWMLWVLLPLVAVLALAGSVILGIYGPVFRQGGVWIGIVALACATNAFVSLAETVIMVQKPRLNLLNSIITCLIALTANLWLIRRFGVTGAAFGILLPYVLQGILRYRALRMVFRWQNPWGDVGRPLLAALVAAAPAVACRLLISGATGQVIAALVFLLLYGGAWLQQRHSIKTTS
jgi:Membrane protein involved in the export of O-antigen and teichoic acid